MIKIKKNLFNLTWKSSFNNQNKSFLLPRKIFFWNKFFFFLNFMLVKGDVNNFFFLKKIINIAPVNTFNISLLYNFSNFRKLAFSVTRLEYFLSFYHYFFLEMLLVNDLTRYNITYLVTSTNCLRVFKTLILKLFFHLNSKFLKMKTVVFLFKNLEFKWTLEFFQSFYQKIEFITNCPDFFLKNLAFYLNFNSKLKSLFISNFNNFVYFNKFYFGYQVFINNALYLNRLILFQTNLSAISFNVLFLKNFNRIFFWTGNFYKDEFLLREMFLWGEPIVSFNKGYPFYNFNLLMKNNILFLNFDYSNLILEKQFNFYFLNKNLTSKAFNFYLKNNLNTIFFLNCFFF